MKLINFKIDNDNIALTTADYYLDLHNNYDLVSFEYRVKKRQFRISWLKNNGSWVDENLPKKLNLNFINTSFPKIKENEKDEFIEDDNRLDTIGFSEIDIRDNMNSWLIKKTEDNSDDMILIFLNGQTIKVNSETVELEFLND
jgi:hypothetical protein